MSLCAETIDALVESGVTAEQLAAFVKAAIAKDEAKAGERRKKDRERKRVQRNPVESVGQDVTPMDADGPLSPNKKSPQTPLKINPNPNPPISPQNQIVSGWNEMAEKHGLPRVAKLTDERKRALKARLREHSVEEILTAIGEVPRNKHWMGEAGWKGNFTTFCRPGHITSFLEAAAANGPATLSVPQRIESYESAAKLYDRMGREDDAAEARRKAEELRKAA